MASLSLRVFDAESGLERSFEFGPSVVRIGRDPASEIVLDSEFVSGLHAEICISAGSAVYRDIGSTNGTQYPSGERLMSWESVCVREQPTLTIGPYTLSFETGAAGQDVDALCPTARVDVEEQPTRHYPDEATTEFRPERTRVIAVAPQQDDGDCATTHFRALPSVGRPGDSSEGTEWLNPPSDPADRERWRRHMERVLTSLSHLFVELRAETESADEHVLAERELADMGSTANLLERVLDWRNPSVLEALDAAIRGKLARHPRESAGLAARPRRLLEQLSPREIEAEVVTSSVRVGPFSIPWRWWPFKHGVLWTRYVERSRHVFNDVASTALPSRSDHERVLVESSENSAPHANEHTTSRMSQSDMIVDSGR